MKLNLPKDLKQGQRIESPQEAGELLDVMYAAQRAGKTLDLKVVIWITETLERALKTLAEEAP